MVMEPLRLVHIPKSPRMMKSGCKTTPHEHSAADQKYKPRRRLKRRKREVLISAPMNHEIPVKAAMIMDMRKSFLSSYKPVSSAMLGSLGWAEPTRLERAWGAR